MSARVDYDFMKTEVLTAEPTVPNAKHKAFADAYLRGNSATSAAKEAGYGEKCAGVTGHKLLKRQDIRAYVDFHKSRATEQAVASKATLTQELSRLAFSNVQDFTRLNADGDLEVDFSAATREQLAAVSGVKVKKRKIFDNKGNVVGEEHQSEFKLWDKLRAAELLGKDIGMFKEPEQKVVVDIADRLLAARQRIIGARRLSDDTVTDD